MADQNNIIMNELLEFGAIRQQEKELQSRKEAIHKEALKQALAELAKTNRTSGEITVGQYVFEVSVADNYAEIIDRPQSYPQEECVDYRYQAKVRARNQAAAKSCTAKMNADLATYLNNHPDWSPDAENYPPTVTLKFKGLAASSGPALAANPAS